jgi:hypothetical protein
MTLDNGSGSNRTAAIRDALREVDEMDRQRKELSAEPGPASVC